MRKSLDVFMVLAFIFLLCGCADREEPRNFADEREAYPTESVPGSFEIVGGRPFILREGEAYCWTEDNQWERYSNGENLVRLYREEYFVALDSEGAIICNYPDEGEGGYMPLASAYAAYMETRMLELSQEYEIKALNKGGGEDWRALLEDGRVMVFMLMPDGKGHSVYQETFIDGEKIVDIVGSYALTGSGKVYKGTINSRNVAQDKNGNGVMEMVLEEWFVWEPLPSDKKITAIYANETNGMCVGLREDGTVIMWPPENKGELDLAGWEKVSEVAVGFNYVVGLTADGEVLYAEYDRDRERKIKQLLQEKRNIVRIACAYQTVALLHSDTTAEMIYLDN